MGGERRRRSPGERRRRDLGLDAPIGAMRPSGAQRARREGKPSQNQAFSLPGSSRRQPASSYYYYLTLPARRQ